MATTPTSASSGFLEALRDPPRRQRSPVVVLRGDRTSQAAKPCGGRNSLELAQVGDNPARSNESRGRRDQVLADRSACADPVSWAPPPAPMQPTTVVS